MFGQLNNSATVFEEEAPSAEVFAELYASEFGWPVFLCHSINADGSCTCKAGSSCTSPGKHPRFKGGFKNATTDVAEISKQLDRYPDSNLAIATGDGLVVIDIDPRHGGDESLAKLEAEMGSLPRHHVARSGNGVHIFLSVPARHGIGCSQSKLGPGIDVKARGGYVIAAPSIHVSGNRYQWEKLTLGPPSEMPESWLSRLRETGCGNEESEAEPQTEECRTRQPSRNTICPISGAARNQSQGNQAGILSVEFPESCLESDWLNPKSETGKRVWAACHRCSVDDHQQTNIRIPALATSLKNIAALRGVTAEQLLPVVWRWFETGCDHMSDREWKSIKKRWQYLWDNWSKPGVGPAWEAAAMLSTRTLPATGTNRRRGIATLKLLCTEMQSQAGSGIWYLSCRTAADVLGSLGIKVSRMTAARWLKQLVADGFLVQPWKHEPGSLQAARYQTAKAVVLCDQLDRDRNQFGIQNLETAIPIPSPSSPPTKHPIALAAVLEYKREAPAFQMPDPLAPSSSISCRPLLLDFSHWWAPQSIDVPLESLSFSLS